MVLYTLPGSYFLPLLLGSLAIASVYSLHRFIRLRTTRRMLIHQNACKPPRKYPQKAFLLGLDTLRDAVLALRSKTFLIRLRRLYNENGNTFSMHSLGSTTVYTIEAENLKYVLSANPKEFGITRTRKDAFGPFLGHNILAAEGAEWVKARAFLRPSFARKQISDVARFDVHVKNLIGALPHDDGLTVDLKALFLCLTADITTDLMFGESINSLRSESFPGFMEAFQDAQFGCEDRARWGKLANFIPQPLFYKSVRLIHEYMDGHVEKGLQYSLSPGVAEKEVETDGRYVLLKELGKVISDRKLLRDELLTIFFAGRDTTASLLCSTFFTLARRPDIWQKLRSEVAQLAGAKPTFTQLNQMSYTKNVLNETLRLFPPLPHNARVSLKDLILPVGGGSDGQSPIFVPAGTEIKWHLSALHQRKDLWGEDADEFRPERFEGDTGSWKYLPFSAGPRQCIGQQFGFTAALYTTVRMVQEFRHIESRDLDPWMENLGVVCFPANGVKVSLARHS